MTNNGLQNLRLSNMNPQKTRSKYTCFERILCSCFKKGCTRLVIKFTNCLLVHGRWFSPGTPASSTTKSGRHDIAETLLKVTLSTINQSINHVLFKLFVVSLVHLFVIYKTGHEPTPYW
jgi:hypothetical protein